VAGNGIIMKESSGITYFQGVDAISPNNAFVLLQKYTCQWQLLHRL